MVTQDEISEGIGLPDALPDKTLAKTLLYPVLSVLIWSLFNSQDLLTGGFYEGWRSRFNCGSTPATNFRYLATVRNKMMID